MPSPCVRWQPSYLRPVGAGEPYLKTLLDDFNPRHKSSADVVVLAVKCLHRLLGGGDSSPPSWRLSNFSQLPEHSLVKSVQAASWAA